MGGKHRLGKLIAATIQELVPTCNRYWEPFVGSGAVTEYITHPNITVSDAHPDLILLWQEIRDGWVCTDEFGHAVWQITKDEYAAWRNAAPSAERTVVGFQGSYRRKWFAGCDNQRLSERRNFSKLFCAKIAKSALRAQILCGSYSDVCRPAAGDVIYCDPPYAGTTAFKGTFKFDSAVFWQWCTGLADQGVHVFASELQAPDSWQTVFEKQHQNSLARTSKRNQNEKLFYRGPAWMQT